MHKPITTPDAQATATTAVAIFCGMMEAGQDPVFEAWSEAGLGGGVELFALCAQYGRLSEEVLLDLVRFSPPPFNFPGVYDYDVSENLGGFLREKILAGAGFEHDEVKRELGSLMVEFFSNDDLFASNPAYAAIIERHTGYVEG